MASVSGAKTCHATFSSTTVDTITLTDKVNQVAVVNHDASNIVYVLVGTSDSSSSAAATAAGTVTAAVDESYAVPKSGRTVVYKNKRQTYVGLSMIGSGGAYSVHGTVWWD